MDQPQSRPSAPSHRGARCRQKPARISSRQKTWRPLGDSQTKEPKIVASRVKCGHHEWPCLPAGSLQIDHLKPFDPTTQPSSPAGEKPHSKIRSRTADGWRPFYLPYAVVDETEEKLSQLRSQRRWTLWWAIISNWARDGGYCYFLL